MPSKTNVIEWSNAGPDDISWVHPDTEIRWGAAVIVHEYESAIFMRDGKIYDVLNPGRHTVDTQNLPLITAAYRLVVGFGETPFKAQVVFIAKKQFVGKFGVNTNVRLSPDNPFPIELQSHGSYFFRISDPVLLLTQFVGGVSAFSTQDVTSTLRALFNEKYIQELNRYSATDVYSKLEETSRKIKNSTVHDTFAQRGIELLDLKIEGVEIPLFKKLQEEDPKAGIALFTDLMKGHGGDYAKLVDTMKALGQNSSSGFLGALLAMPQLMPNVIQSMPHGTPQQSNSITNALRELKKSLDEGLITQEDYDKTKNRLLGGLQE